MWFRGIGKQDLKKLIVEAVHEEKDYPVRVLQLKKELAELKLQRDIEEREIKHLVKLKEEKLGIENQKKILEMEQNFVKKEMDLQREFHNKVLAQINVARSEMKEVYTKIMERLPNLNASLEIKRKE